MVINDQAAMQNSVGNLQLFVSIISNKGWGTETRPSDYQYSVKTLPNSIKWQLDLAGASTKVRFTKHNNRTVIAAREKIDYSWTDFRFYVSIYIKHLDLVQFVGRN